MYFWLIKHGMLLNDHERDDENIMICKGDALKLLLKNLGNSHGAHYFVIHTHRILFGFTVWEYDNAYNFLINTITSVQEL